MARSTGTGIELPTRRESMIPTTQETDDELEVTEPLMIENFRQLKAWMKHDGQAVSDMLQELKKAYNDSIDRSNLATDMAEIFQKRMNQLEGIVEYQKEELREARRQASAIPTNKTRERLRPRSPSRTPSTQRTDGTIDKKKSMKLPPSHFY